MKSVALLIVILLVISQHLVYSASIKASIYNATLTYGSFDCDRFANLFSGNGQFSTPRGTFNGPQAVVTECKRMKSKIAGSGAYPHDMYVTSSSAAFFFHIRALSVDDCHIDWPGIVEIEYDQYGKISNFNHQYDDDWMDASYACKLQSVFPSCSKQMENSQVQSIHPTLNPSLLVHLQLLITYLVHYWTSISWVLVRTCMICTLTMQVHLVPSSFT